MPPRISVVIACFNEEPTIRECVMKVNQQKELLDLEVIVVDDCSTDGTKKELELLRAEGKVSEALFHTKNQGKGAALKTGFKVVSGSIVIIQDADLECDPREYTKLIEPIIQDFADVVYGSRFTLNGSRYVGSFKRFIANKFLTYLSNLFTDLHLTDMETCYKVFRKSILENMDLREARFGFEPEFTHEIARMKLSVCEVPISYRPRKSEDGKKIRVKDGFRAIYVIVRCGLFRRK